MTDTIIKKLVITSSLSLSSLLGSNRSCKKVTIEITIGEQDNKAELNCTKRCPIKINNTEKHFKNSDKSTNVSIIIFSSLLIFNHYNAELLHSPRSDRITPASTREWYSDTVVLRWCRIRLIVVLGGMFYDLAVSILTFFDLLLNRFLQLHKQAIAKKQRCRPKSV